MTYIARRLEVVQEDGKAVEYSDAEFFALQAPLVVLGEPGAGKSVLVKEFQKTSGSQFYYASGLLPESIAPAVFPARIIIDGLDEITAYKPGAPIVDILGKLAMHQQPNFVLTCRAVDWQHAANSTIISRHWQKAPIVGRLLPLNDEEIISFIAAENSTQDAAAFLKEARKRDVADLLRNPQNLLMLLKTVKNSGWPTTRSELFERSCAALVTEENEMHGSLSGNARPANDVLLEAAGFVCAQLLLSGTTSIAVDGTSTESQKNASDFTSEGFDTATIRQALATKIFRAAGHNAVEPCHRTVSEYLAARWLASALSGQLSLTRLEQLLYGNDYIVPSALRGLHAWLATLSPNIAKTLVTRDPYGFFRYGDAATLNLDQAQHLLQSLEALADIDPYFRSEDWHATFGRGLARSELRDDIIRVIRSRTAPYQLKHLIIESIQGDAFADSIAEDLLALVLDASATPVERQAAVDVLTECKTQPDWPETVKKLREAGDVESLRIALQYIIQDHVEMFDGSTIAEILVAISEEMAEDDGPNYAGIGWGIDKKMSLVQLEDALRVLAECAPPEKSYQKRKRYQEPEAWIYRFAQERLERAAPPPASTLWSWLKHSEKHNYHRSEWDKYSKELFSQYPDYRRAVQAEALAAVPDAEDLWMALHYMGDASAGLWLREDDVLFHIDALAREPQKHAKWALHWRDLVQWARANRDFTGEALELARRQATQHPELQEQLTILERPPERDYQKEWQKQERQYKRQENKQTSKRHEEYKKIQSQLPTGQPLGAFYEIANAYLGRYSNIRAETGLERIAQLIGHELVPIALEGIAAAVVKDDIPTPKQMTELRANDSKNYFIEPVLLVHCAISVGNGRTLAELPLPVAASALAACQWGLRWIGDDTTPDVQKQLEVIVFADKSSKESFLRDTLEPYLANGAEHISGLYRLANTGDFPDVAGALSIEWLTRFPKLSKDSLEYLIKAAIRYAPHDQLIAIVRERIDNNAWENEEQRALWISAAFLLDYAHYTEMLSAYANENPAHLWSIRGMAVLDRDMKDGYWPQLTPEQNHFLIRNFGAAWPPASHPSSGWCGDTNPWDASQFIAARINALAADVSEQAAGLLKGLVNRPELAGYHDQMKHVAAQQARRRAEANKATPALGAVRSVLLQGDPANIDDLQALIMDELALLQRRLRDGTTNGVQAFWENDLPRGENYCRDRIVEHLEPHLQKFKVRCYTESTMPHSTRCDFLNAFGEMNLPVEVKGQWHPELWTAAAGQLQNYAGEYRAQGRGIYLALWFGRVSGKNPPLIAGEAALQMAQDLENALHSQYAGKIPEATRIFVLDLSQPALPKAPKRQASPRKRTMKKEEA